MGAHIVGGQFQSDKYPTCPPGKVPLSVKDKTAQDLLWEYSHRRRSVDPEFSDDLQTALLAAGYKPPTNESVLATAVRAVLKEWDEGTLSKGAFEHRMRETISHFARVYFHKDGDLDKLVLVAKLAYKFKRGMQAFFIGGKGVTPFWEAIENLPSSLLNEAFREIQEAEASKENVP
jgi:hypothetical protein